MRRYVIAAGVSLACASCISIPERTPLDGDGGVVDASTDADRAGRKRTISLAPNPPISADILTPTPIAILLDADADYIANGRTNGSDLLFYSGSAPLPHEIEHIDQPAGNLLVWVRLPSFAAAGETLDLYYGGTPRTTNQPSDVFADWDLVWHFGDHDVMPNEAKDSAGDNPGRTGGALVATPGVVGSGIGLAGQALRSPDPSSSIYPGTDPYTISLWVTTTAEAEGSAAVRLGVLDANSFGTQFLFEGGRWNFETTIPTFLVATDPADLMPAQRAHVSIHVDRVANSFTPIVNGANALAHIYNPSLGSLLGSAPLVVGDNTSGTFDEVRLVRRNRSLDELSIERQNALNDDFVDIEPALDANYP